MDIEMPENFPYDKPPKKGDTEQFLVDATFQDGRKWTINTVDGVTMGSPGKASAPGDDGEGAGDAADETEGAGDSDAENGDPQTQDETNDRPEPSGKAPVSVGGAFASKVMGG